MERKATGMTAASAHHGIGASGVEQQQEDIKRCRACYSQALKIDWAQGDRICTNCGVVDEQHLLDETPEWRDYGGDDELAKGKGSSARCGMVEVDETKYLGGLQPTGLSKQAFGGPMPMQYDNNGDRQSVVAIQRNLTKINRKIDFMMEKNHDENIRQARLSRFIRKRAREEISQEDEDIRPEYDQIILQEEAEEENEMAKERAKKDLEAAEADEAYQRLCSEKWSLQRAILLYGSNQERNASQEAERNELMSRLDKPLKAAASDLYKAYKMIQKAANDLDLPAVVTQQSISIMCQYAVRQEGFKVRGVASRMSKSSTIPNNNTKNAADTLREHNKLKQMASLASALLFLTGRKLGATRALQQVCSTFTAPSHNNNNNVDSFVKAKHCSKAMTELRTVFPDLMRSLGSLSGASTGNYVEHTLKKLNLPPVASISIQVLVDYLQKNDAIDQNKIATVCASVAFFVCMAGEMMQRLALQSKKTIQDNDNNNNDDNDKKKTKSSDKKSKRSKKNRPFDVFSHAPIQVDPSEQMKYETRRTWDAWSEQVPWARPLLSIEQSCGVSRRLILDFYKTKLFPQRHFLLEYLRDAAAGNKDGPLRETPRASSLLSNIGTAAALMTKTMS